MQARLRRRRVERPRLLVALALYLLASAATAQSVVVELVADVCAGTCAGIEDSSYSAAGKTRFYFAGSSAAEGSELWVTDGTSAGTQMLADIRPGSEGSFPRSLITIGDVLYFSASTPPLGDWREGRRLWRSDGTPGGTLPVDFPVPGPKSVFTIGSYDFIHYTSRGVVMPSTDGLWWVPADNPMPRKLHTGHLVGRSIVEWNGHIYFVVSPCEIFCQASGQPADLYRFDPVGGVAKIATLSLAVSAEGLGIPAVQLGVGEKGVFVSPQPRELWFTGGSAAPVFVRRWSDAGWLGFDTWPSVDGVGAFYASEDDYSGALWTSDGTNAGTKPLTRLSIGYHEYPRKLGNANGKFLIGISPEVRPSGYRDAPALPLHSDLTVLDALAPHGLRSIRALSPANDRANISNPIPFERGVLFTARGTTASSPNTGGVITWVTDGTTGGTQPIDPVAFGDMMPLEMVGHVQGWTYLRGWRKDTGYEFFRMRLSDEYPPTYSTVEVTEFYHAVLDHYFITGDEGEKAKLDAGSTSGWRRTGFGFSAYAAGSGAPGVAPVCRFYGRPEAGLDSHFYSASPKECADVEARFSHAWIKETANVFEVVPPDLTTGWCTAPFAPLYRAYNGRGDVNHRYSVHSTDQKLMQGKGWTPEGSTSAGIAMCVLATTRP